MTTDLPDRDLKATFVNYDEPPSRSAPILSVGPLAWVRENLFNSLLDTVLTFVSILTFIGVIWGVAYWSIRQANWFVVNFNMRQFMMGRYEQTAEWRLNLTVLIVMFIVGVVLRAFSRIGWRVFVIMGVVLAVTFGTALILTSVFTLPPSYLVTANVPIQSGSVTRDAITDIGFIGQAGETIHIEVADAYLAGEEALAGLHGFADQGTNDLRNSADNRLLAIDRQAQLAKLLAEDPVTGTVLLTAHQVEAFTAEYDELTIPEPVIGTYHLDEAAAEVRITRSTTGDLIGEAVLTANGDSLELTLPEDGWYILHKSISGDVEGAVLLEAYGISPILERSFSLSEIRDDEGAITQEGRRVNQYIRMTDGYLLEAQRPTIDGDDIPFMIIIDNQYRGLRTTNDFLRVYFGPFLLQIVPALAILLLATALGFAAGQFADRTFSPEVLPRRASLRMSTWLLIALPAVVFVLAYGLGNILPVTDTRNWGGLLLTMMLTMVGIIAAFPLGVLLALGRRSDLPAVKYASTFYIEFVRGVPLITVLFMAQLLVPFLNPALANVDNVFRAMIGITLFSAAYLAENVRGGLQSIPPGQVEAARALGLAGWHITLFITLPQALRAVIPALVGQFISLFKDTSLVAIVGLIDLTGISNAVVAQTEFLGLRREAYFFITILYFVFSYVMSWVSRKIEQTGSGAVRRG